MTALFLTGYIVIALICVGLGLYLSYPGHTLLTLPHDALNLLPRRSRPASTSAPHDEPATPVDEHNAETQYHLATPVIPLVADESHESHTEAEPAEAVHDEP